MTAKKASTAKKPARAKRTKAAAGGAESTGASEAEVSPPAALTVVPSPSAPASKTPARAPETEAAKPAAAAAPTPNGGTAAVKPGAPLSAEQAAKTGQATKMLEDIFRLMKFPAKLEVKDQPDGSISVAIFFEGEVAGVQPGKRSFVIDCVQLLVNKAINRPNTERRWINLGVGGHPPPRPPQGQPQQQPPRNAPPQAQQQRAAPPRNSAPPPAQTPRPPPEPEVTVAPDETWTALLKTLASRAAAKGRIYAIGMLSPEDRARAPAALQGAPDVTVRMNGERHLRRLEITPRNITPMPKRTALPDFDDEDDDG